MKNCDVAYLKNTLFICPFYLSCLHKPVFSGFNIFISQIHFHFNNTYIIYIQDIFNNLWLLAFKYKCIIRKKFKKDFLGQKMCEKEKKEMVKI